MSSRDLPHRFSPRFRPSEALLLFVAAPVLILVAGPALAPLGLGGMVLAQLAFIAGPALWLAHRRRRPLTLLGLRRTSAATLAGAVLIGASFWYVSVWLVVPISNHLAGNADEIHQLDTLFFGGTSPLAVKLAAIALVPALCEEILMRGVVARSLRPAVGATWAVIISAVLFGALHLSATRLLPTTTLGLILGASALAADSAIPAVLIHVENNGIIVLLGSGVAPQVAAALSARPETTKVTAISALCAGIGLVAWGRSRRLARMPGPSPTSS